MGKWNEESAPNNNLPVQTINSSEQLLGKQAEHKFSEELSDGAERDQFIELQNQTNKVKQRK